MDNQSNKTPGLRKYVAQPQRYAARYGNFTLTSRDYDILDLVYRYRHLESRHVRALTPGSDQQITRRLQGLFHNQYLGRYIARQRMRMELDPGTPQIAYGLELKGARTLDAQRIRRGLGRGGEVDSLRWRKAYSRRTEWFLEHRLMISHFRCVLSLAVQVTPSLEFVCWEDALELSARSSPLGTRFGLAPDGYFALRDHGEVRHFFLEADRSTEEHSRLERKFRAYWWYLQSPEYRDSHLNHQRVNVLFVTTGQQRMLNMIETLQAMSKPNRPQYGGKGLFLFGHDRSYSLENPCSVLHPIWRNAASGAVALQ